MTLLTALDLDDPYTLGDKPACTIDGINSGGALRVGGPSQPLFILYILFMYAFRALYKN